MVYDELKIVFAILVIILALVLIAIVNGGQDRSTESEEAVGLRCWCEEWADVREAQAEYLERRGR